MNKLDTKKRNRQSKRAICLFTVSLGIAIMILVLSIMKTHAYNMARHSAYFFGSALFYTRENRKEEVYIVAETRDSTWTKAFDLNNEGITDHNYQAFTVNYTVVNNTKDEISDFSFKLTFHNRVYLLSAWNGAVEIHQNVNGREIVDTVADLREFVPEHHGIKSRKD